MVGAYFSDALALLGVTKGEAEALLKEGLTTANSNLDRTSEDASWLQSRWSAAAANGLAAMNEVIDLG